MWQHWLNFILGILAVIFAHAGASTTSLVVIGVLIIIFSLWGGLSGGGRKTPTTP